MCVYMYIYMCMYLYIYRINPSWNTRCAPPPWVPHGIDHKTPKIASNTPRLHDRNGEFC